MAGFNIDQIVAEWGARYTPEGQTMKDIRKEIFTPSETEKYFKKRPNKGDFFKSAYASIDEVTQAFQIEFQAKGTATFQPWETRLGEYKIDAFLEPDTLRGAWTGFMAELEQKDRSKWMIVRWMISQLLIPKSHEEMEIDQAFWGWQKTAIVEADPVVDGATRVREFVKGPTPANAAVNGIWLQLILMVAAGRCNVINTGALSNDPITLCNQVENFYKSIPKRFRNKLDYIFMSEFYREIYEEGRRLKYNGNYKQVDDLRGIARQSRTKVQDLDSMDGSEKLWTTMPDNRVNSIAEDHDGSFDVQKVDRGVKLLSDWKKVLTFDVPEFVWTNDQQNVISAAEIAEFYS